MRRETESIYRYQSSMDMIVKGYRNPLKALPSSFIQVARDSIGARATRTITLRQIWLQPWAGYGHAGQVYCKQTNIAMD